MLCSVVFLVCMNVLSKGLGFKVFWKGLGFRVTGILDGFRV